MSTPLATDKLNGYQYDWEAERVSISVSRIKTDRDGNVKGEIRVSTTADEVAGHHLHQAYFNFSSSGTRKQLATTLKDRYSEADWDSILEQLCVYVMERVRKGEPLQELWTGDDIEKPNYLLEPLVIENYANILFGDPSSAKSTIATILQQIIQLPWLDNPMRLTPNDKSYTCLYLDWETDSSTIRWQTNMLVKGHDMPPLSINYRQCHLPLHHDIEQIAEHINDIGAKVIIIDSLGLAAGGNLNEPEAALNFYAALRRLKTTSLILAHNSKDRESKTRSIYGNQFFTAQARNVWEIRKSQESGSDEMDIALYHRKPAPFMKLHEPIGFKVVFDNNNGGMRIEPSDPRNIGEFIDQMHTTDRIYAFLRNGTANNSELCEALKVTTDTLRQATKRLKDKGLIVRLDDGRWGLVENNKGGEF